MLCSDFFLEPATIMRPGAKVEKVYLYPKPVDFRKPIDGLAGLVELDITRWRCSTRCCSSSLISRVSG